MHGYLKHSVTYVVILPVNYPQFLSGQATRTKYVSRAKLRVYTIFSSNNAVELWLERIQV